MHIYSIFTVFVSNRGHGWLWNCIFHLCVVPQQLSCVFPYWNSSKRIGGEVLVWSDSPEMCFNEVHGWTDSVYTQAGRELLYFHVQSIDWCSLWQLFTLVCCFKPTDVFVYLPVFSLSVLYSDFSPVFCTLGWLASEVHTASRQGFSLPALSLSSHPQRPSHIRN